MISIVYGVLSMVMKNNAIIAACNIGTFNWERLTIENLLDQYDREFSFLALSSGGMARDVPVT